MNFDIKQSQNNVWNRLYKSIENDKIGSAYLFSGPSGAGKEAMAIEFGAEINKYYWRSDAIISEENYNRFKFLQHELLKIIIPLPVGKASKETSNPLGSLTKMDLDTIKENIDNKASNPFHKIIIPGATRIRIDSIRELRKTLYLKSDDAGRKIVLIFDAHFLTVGQAESANALLKILEEPPSNTSIILVTDRKNQLLPTILSRCQHIDFPQLTTEIIKETLQKNDMDIDTAELIAGIAQGNMRRALILSEESIEKIIERIQNLAKDILSRDGKKWKKFINDNSQFVRKDIAQFYYNLFLLQLWFKSAYRLRIGVSDELHRPELANLIQKFNTQYPYADLQKIDIIFENTFEAVGRNLYMSLILTNLLISIQRLLK